MWHERSVRPESALASFWVCGAGHAIRSNKPPRRMNGRSVRLPSDRGGSSRARTLPKWQSVP
eukprot:4567224-Pleurochrysis_carterae.AAC.1